MSGKYCKQRSVNRKDISKLVNVSKFSPLMAKILLMPLYCCHVPPTHVKTIADSTPANELLVWSGLGIYLRLSTTCLDVMRDEIKRILARVRTRLHLITVPSGRHHDCLATMLCKHPWTCTLPLCPACAWQLLVGSGRVRQIILYCAEPVSPSVSPTLRESLFPAAHNTLTTQDDTFPDPSTSGHLSLGSARAAGLTHHHAICTKLDLILDDPDVPAMTLFAPSEDAWTKLPSNVLIGLATNTTALKEVLLGHVIDQVVLGQYVRDKDSKVNRNGDELNFRVFPNKVKTIDWWAMTTPWPTHDTDFRDLFGLLVLGRLFGPLETTGPYTLFAPVDLAFEAIRDTVTVLINNRTALADVLEYHVVPDTYWSVGLTDGMKLPTLNGAELTISVGLDGVKVDNAKVVQADIHTSNGVIHVVDTVVTPAP
ncbi:hypothetical protein RRG08_028309 [Elysia crispata]|uniref:FAS1 domain-containing protein n=1 Tax=Elysia crispata TaxID=231223 RepID=A0AAE1AWC7_9GAST|nr:hypothetical protein RRG08_028309 [Elysia crispata]